MTKTKIFIINGYPTVGKDYLIKSLNEIHGIDIKNISTVDLPKNISIPLGYSEEDKQKFRCWLSDLKDLIDKHFDKLTIRCCVDMCEENKYNFIHSREPENIDLLKRLCIEKGYDVNTILVTADWIDTSSLNNHADLNVMNYKYDLVFENTKDVNTFNTRLENFKETLNKL